jgi:hypothetical protein
MKDVIKHHLLLWDSTHYEIKPNTLTNVKNSTIDTDRPLYLLSVSRAWLFVCVHPSHSADMKTSILPTVKSQEQPQRGTLTLKS